MTLKLPGTLKWSKSVSKWVNFYVNKEGDHAAKWRTQLYTSQHGMEAIVH